MKPRKNQTIINVSFSLISLITNLAINFFLAPIIVGQMGEEAYGFVLLANNFITYASLFTIALNSVAARFVSIHFHKKEKEKTNKYFNSIFFANIFLSAFLMIVGFFLIVYLEKIIVIPTELVTSVKTLFSLITVSFIANTVFAVFSTTLFVANRLDVRYKKQVQGLILQTVIIFSLIFLLKADIVYVGIATLAYALYVNFFNFYYTRRDMKEIEIKFKYFSLKTVFEVLSLGIWNTVSNCGNVLIDGLDLLISNLMLSPQKMGELAISKSITLAFKSLIGNIGNIYNPRLTENYANGEKEKLIYNLQNAMRLTGFFSGIPLVLLIGFGTSFYTLWQPTQNAELLYILSVLAVGGVFLSGVITPMWYIYTLTNKLKVHSLIVLGASIISIVVTITLLKTTDLGLYAIAGTSTVITLLRNAIITPTYTAHVLGVKKTTFYPLIFKYLGVTLLFLAITLIINSLFVTDTWISLISVGLITGAIGFMINYVLFINPNDREYIISLVKERIKK